MPAPLRIVIAEDAAIMRDGLTQTLTRRGHDVVAAVGDAVTLRDAIDDLAPDVAVIDVRMPPTHTDEGLRAAQSIHADHPRVGVLVFSAYIETRSAAELFSGAPAGVGYLLEDRVADVASSSTPFPASRGAGPSWTRRSSASCCGPAAGPRGWPRSRPASGRCSH